MALFYGWFLKCCHYCYCNFHTYHLMIIFYIPRCIEDGHAGSDETIPGVMGSVREASLLLGVGVMGHSWDTYSDIAFSYQLASGTYKPAKGKTF